MAIMIDIETMSTHPSNAVVLQVALVVFRLEQTGPSIGDRFVTDVPDVREQLFHGRLVGSDTQQFWDKNKDAAGSWAMADQSPVLTVLDQISKFITEHQPYDFPGGFWANGIVFDMGNIESLYRAYDRAMPWKYNAVRDARTVYRCFEPFRDRTNCIGVEAHFAHDPLSDCIDQIFKLWEHWPGELPADVVKASPVKS